MKKLRNLFIVGLTFLKVDELEYRLLDFTPVESVELFDTALRERGACSIHKKDFVLEVIK